MKDRRKPSSPHLGLLLLAAIGAGTLVGALVGLLLGRRVAQDADAVITESVEALRAKAQQVLGELSENVAGLRAQAGETRSAVKD